MLLCLLLAACALLAAACGTQTKLVRPPTVTIATSSVHAPAQIGYPLVATKNTTRVAGPDPIADAAAVALAVYPSSGAGTHPPVVTLAPTGDWQAALAASVLMAAPIRAPILLSGPGLLPTVTGQALTALAPAGSGASGGAQVIRVGPVPRIIGLQTIAIRGNDPFTLAAAIDRFASAAAGTASPDVIVASADDPQYAMPAAGLAAESGDPILFVNSSGVSDADQAGAALPPEAAHLRARPRERDPGQRADAAAQVRHGQASRRSRPGGELGGLCQVPRPPLRQAASRAPTCRAASAGRSRAPVMATR